MEGRHTSNLCLLLISFMMSGWLSAASIAAEFRLEHTPFDFNHRPFEELPYSFTDYTYHQHLTIQTQAEIVAALTAGPFFSSPTPSKVNHYQQVEPVAVVVQAGYHKVQSRHDILLDISSSSTADLMLPASSAPLEFSIQRQFQATIRADDQTPLALDIYAEINCSCLDNSHQLIAKSGNLFWRSAETSIQIRLEPIQSTSPLSLEMQLAPKPFSSSPLVVSEGHAHLRDDGNINQFRGLYVMAFTQDRDCVQCVHAVFVGSTENTPQNEALIVAMQNLQ